MLLRPAGTVCRADDVGYDGPDATVAGITEVAEAVGLDSRPRIVRCAAAGDGDHFVRHLTALIIMTALAAAWAPEAAMAAIDAGRLPVEAGGWWRDARTDCELWNASPQDDGMVIWSGACVNGRAHGHGMAEWRYIEDDDWVTARYEGEYRAGRRHGHGLSMMANGDRYRGDYREGQRHGDGVYIWASGDRYQGTWRDGKRRGLGVWTGAGGHHYEGAWQDDLPNGHGVWVWPSGDRYDGAFADGAPNGTGIWLSHDGDRYVGEFRNGRAHGHGVWIGFNGDTHDGEWRDNERQGYGIMSRVDGSRFEGEFVDDRPDGVGICRDRSGAWGRCRIANGVILEWLE